MSSLLGILYVKQQLSDLVKTKISHFARAQWELLIKASGQMTVGNSRPYFLVLRGGN